MAKQRIRVEGRDAWLVVLIAAVAGVGAVAAGPSPTGSTVIDALLVGVAGAVVVWAAASAPWWAGVVAAGIAATFAPSALLVVVAAAAMVGGLAVGVAQRTLPWSRALVAAVSVQVFARLGEVGSFGRSALIAIVVLAVLALLGVQRRPRTERRVVWSVLAALFVAGVLALLGFGVAGAAARPDVEHGIDVAERGIDELAAGDFDAASASFEDAARLLASADHDLGRLWAQPVRLVPVAAQHRTAAAELVATAASVSGDVAAALTQIDLDAVRVRDGRIDVAAVAALEVPLQQLRTALDDLAVTVHAIDDPWLADGLTDRLDELVADIDAQRVRGDNVVRAVHEAPAMLGGDGIRRYFIAITTPVEARGLGGFMGNWAEVTITDGDIDVTRFGRHTDLNADAGDPDRFVTGPADFLEMWGELGFRMPDGTARDNIWSDITTSPQFPSVAQVIAELYPQSGGSELDGVFAMDVYTVAALMEITGPVDVEGTDVTVTPESAVEFFLNDQYELFETYPDRVGALESVAVTTIERLLSSELPSPPDLADLLSPYVREGRLVAWSSHPEEQELFELVRMDGAMPDPRGGDALSVVLNNSGNNKIDYYLDGAADYRVTTSPGSDVVEAELTVTLHNAAPGSGAPVYVINNAVGRPPGTNYLYLAVYGQLAVQSAEVDGEPARLRSRTEAGSRVTSFFVEIPSGATVDVVVELAGTVPDVDAFTRTLVWRGPAAVRPVTLTASVDGVPLSGSPVTEAGVTRLERAG